MHRFHQIDILRAIAVILVLGRHMTPCPSEVNLVLHHITSIWRQGGWIGVDVFFVLSGFLVSGLLFREYEKHSELHVGRFLIRRGFKIYPPFWLLIAATAFWGFVYKVPVHPHAIASELLFLQNYRSYLWYHTWSLAVEEHFYLLLALGAYFLARRRRRNPFRIVPLVFLILACCCLAWRIRTCSYLPFNPKTHLALTHLRLDGLFFGVLISYAFHRDSVQFLAIARRFRYVSACLGLVLLTPAFCTPVEDSTFLPTFGLSLFYLGSGCLLIAALGARNSRTIYGRALAYTGSHSYSVYLWHVPLTTFATAVAEQSTGQPFNWYAYATFYFVGSVSFGIGMAIVTEFPVLKMRDYLFPSRGRTLSSKGTDLSGL
jgi:peptidoglycan/LPS O-acetylase OafA/YrhL